MRVIKFGLIFLFGMFVIVKGAKHIIDSKSYVTDGYTQCRISAGLGQINTEGAIFESREEMNVTISGENNYAMTLKFETSDKTNHTVVCHFEKNDIKSFEVK